MRIARLAVIAITLGAALPGQAAERTSRFYTGGGVGQAWYDMNFESQVRGAYADTPFTVTDARTSDDKDTGFRLFGGYRFGRYVAAELGYVNLGSTKGHYAVLDAGLHLNDRNTEHELSGAQLSLVGMLPIGERLTLHGKLGAIAARLEYSERGTDGRGDPYAFDSSDTQVRFAWGAGVGWRFTDRLSARLDWDRYEKIGRTFSLNESGNGKFDHVDTFAANLIWNF